MTQTRNRMIVLGLASIFAAATMPALAAAPMSNAAALQAAASDNVTQVRDGGHRRAGRAARAYGYAFPDAYGYAYPNAYGYADPDAYAYGYPFANAYGYAGAYPYSGGSANGYDCLGGRDSSGVPCGY
jgi:hypothetical protein